MAGAHWTLGRHHALRVAMGGLRARRDIFAIDRRTAPWTWGARRPGRGLQPLAAQRVAAPVHPPGAHPLCAYLRI
jgi:hypothetical protein